MRRRRDEFMECYHGDNHSQKPYSEMIRATHNTAANAQLEKKGTNRKVHDSQFHIRLP